MVNRRREKIIEDQLEDRMKETSGKNGYQAIDKMLKIDTQRATRMISVHKGNMYVFDNHLYINLDGMFINIDLKKLEQFVKSNLNILFSKKDKEDKN